MMPSEIRAQRDKAREIAVHLEQENAHLLSIISAVRTTHFRTYEDFSALDVCGSCGHDYPCTTIRILDEKGLE